MNSPAADDDPAIAEMDRHPERYGVDGQAVRRCPACGRPGRVTDEDGRRVVDFPHHVSCWLHGPAAQLAAHLLDETAYLGGEGPMPFERDEEAEHW